MVTKWGLSEKLGPLAYSEEEGEVFLGRSVTQTKQVSEQYLVNATSVTHAEALVNKDFQDSGVDFEVKAVQDTRICKVIETQNS